MTQTRHDLTAGMVDDELDSTLVASTTTLEKWTSALNARARDSTGPGFVPFGPDDRDPLEKAESLLDSAVGADPSLAGTLQALGGGALAMLNNPIAVAVDEYQAGAVRELQTAFLKDNRDVLIALDESLREAKNGMRELAEMLELASVGSNWPEPGRVLAEKSQVGDLILRDLEKAIATTEDPSEREQLAADRTRLIEWMQERDARIEAERPEVDAFRERMSELWDRLISLRPVMREASGSPGPRTEIGRSHEGAPLRVLRTTHHQPDAVAHVVSLHDLMLATRIELTDALSPQE